MSVRRKSTLSWAEKHVTLSGQPFRREDWPLLVNILETIEANPGSRFIILGAVQTVKTLLAQLYLLRCMQVEPAATLWYTKTDDQADSFVDQKFTPIIDSTPLKERAFHGDPNKTTRKRKMLPSGHIYQILSAGPLINRQQHSAQTEVLDEFWTYEKGWHAEIENRHAAPEFAADWREIIVSTAANDGHILGRLFAESTQFNLEWLCDGCGREYVPVFGEQGKQGGLKYKSCNRVDGTPDKAAIHASAEWECPHCGHRMKHSAPTIKRLTRPGAWKQTNPAPAPRTFGWWIPDWLVRDWGDLAVQWAEANYALKLGSVEPLEKLVLTRFAQAWKPLEQRRDSKPKRNVGAYKMGEKWDQMARDEYGRPMAFVTVDVQKDHYVCVARAWARGGKSRLLEVKKCAAQSEIRDMALRHGIEPFRVFLDARHDTDNVGRLCSSYGWRMLMGDKANDYHHPTDGKRHIYSEPRNMDPFLGLAHEGQYSVPLFLFSKNRALDRFATLRSLGVEQWSGASDAPEWYWRETEAHYTIIKKKEDGSEMREWRGERDDHAGDCEVMQCVLATICGLLYEEAVMDAQPPAKVDG